MKDCKQDHKPDTCTHTYTDTQIKMSLIRCEHNPLMIIICTMTLQRLRIRKRVTAVKLRDSLTGINMVQGFVCFCVFERATDRGRLKKDMAREQKNGKDEEIRVWYFCFFGLCIRHLFYRPLQLNKAQSQRPRWSNWS